MILWTRIKIFQLKVVRHVEFRPLKILRYRHVSTMPNVKLRPWLTFIITSVEKGTLKISYFLSFLSLSWFTFWKVMNQLLMVSTTLSILNIENFWNRYFLSHKRLTLCCKHCRLCLYSFHYIARLSYIIILVLSIHL